MSSAPAIMQPIKKQRLLSLDFFRGLTVASMILVNNPGDWEHVYPPLEHSAWNGCTPTDLVFPFFLFMVGVSITLAIGPKKDDKTSHTKMILTALKRSIIIYLIFTALHFLGGGGFSNFRILGVLPRIAIVFFISVIIYVKTTFKQQAWMFAIILILYNFLMRFVPVPGIGAGLLEPGKNLAAWIDYNILTPAHMWRGTKTWDPEGILSTLPAISTCLFGIMVGTELRRKDKPEANKATWLFSFAVLSIMAGMIWNWFFPINKALWTSSFVLYTGGLATAGLTLSYWLIDVQQRRKYTTPLVAFGSNAILTYVAADVVLELLGLFHVNINGNEVGLQEYLYQHLFPPVFSPFNASLAGALAYVLMLMIPMVILYKKKIFIKV